MTLKNRTVKFKARDIHLPDPSEVLLALHGDDVLQGEVVDLSASGAQEAAFALVRVEGLANDVIVPVERILSVE